MRQPLVTYCAQTSARVPQATQRVHSVAACTWPSAAFQVDQQLNTATLNTTLEVFDYVSTRSYPVDISVRWTATGDAVRLKGSTQTRSAGFLVSERFDGSERQATASGTIILNGSSNLTLEPDGFAKIRSLKSGTTVISR